MFLTHQYTGNKMTLRLLQGHTGYCFWAHRLQPKLAELDKATLVNLSGIIMISEVDIFPEATDHSQIYLQAVQFIFCYT